MGCQQKSNAVYPHVTQALQGVSTLQATFLIHTVLRDEVVTWIMAVYKYSISNLLERTMIRIVCPHCHAPLSTLELEHATLNGSSCLLCPECSSILVSDSPEPESHGLSEHIPAESFAHA